MKKILFIVLLLNISVNAQVNLEKEKKTSVYLKFLPSNVDPQNLRPSDIPSEQVLRKMGFSDKEIESALDFKFSRGEFAKEIQDTLDRAGIKAVVDQDEMDAHTVDVYTNETEYEVKKALKDEGVDLEPSFRFAY